MLVSFAAHAGPADFPDVTAIARHAVTSGELPGALVLIARDGEVRYLEAFGLRALVPDPAPMTRTTIFDVASLTKPLGTALAVMSLLERGALSLDAPVGTYLPEFDDAALR